MATPLLAEHVADGALALYRPRRNTAGGWNADHLTTLFSAGAIAEALRDGWSVPGPRGEELCEVVVVDDVVRAVGAM